LRILLEAGEICELLEIQKTEFLAKDVVRDIKQFIMLEERNADNSNNPANKSQDKAVRKRYKY
jgi:hypothetical protein